MILITLLQTTVYAALTRNNLDSPCQNVILSNSIDTKAVIRILQHRKTI